MRCSRCDSSNPEPARFCSRCGAPLREADATLPDVTRTISASFSEIEPGAVLGQRYSIQEELGRGGMGVVYKARDEKLGRIVALKLLPQGMLHIPEIKERFLQEARAAAALDHTNICTLYESDEAEGRPFISMAYIEGQDLKDKITKGALPWKDAVNIGIQIGEGLEEAHRKGIVHRDIKSGNIRITPEGKVKIMDFGIARITGSTLVTQEGTTMGTAAYMSPEQARGAAVDQRTDVWSLGVVLYEMLTGRLPFRGESAQAMIYSVLNDAPAPMEGLDPSVEAELTKVVGKTLSKDVGFRYASSRDLIMELERLLSGGTVLAETIVHEVLDKTVAVFDFANITRDPESDWLSSGIAETVGVDLKKVSSLKVMGREQVLRALGNQVGQRVPEQQIIDLGTRLGVRWIVWGAFQKMGDAIRITSHFTEVSSGNLIGSVKIDGTLSDIFSLQDEIIARLMDSLQLEVTDTERKKLEAPLTIEVEAYECYAKGRHLINKMGRSGMADAMDLFKKAVALDPDYALAYSGLGNMYSVRYIADSDPADLDLAIRYLMDSIERDPDLTDPWLWLSYGYTRQRQYIDAIRCGQKAVELEPDHPLAHYFLGVAYLVRAASEYHVYEYPRALDHYRINARLQPNYQPAYMNAAWIYLLHGQYTPALRLLNQACSIEESGKAGIVIFVGSMTLMGNLYLRWNEFGTALEWYQRSLALLDETDHVYTPMFQALTYCGMGRVSIFHREFDQAMDLFQSANRVITANAEGLGIGYIQVKVLLGLAVTFHELGMTRESKGHFAQAEDLIKNKRPFDFSWVWEGCDAQAYYDLAAYQALCHHTEKALRLLEKARQCGWADISQLDADSSFSDLRKRDEFSAFRLEVAKAAPLPEYEDF